MSGGVTVNDVCVYLREKYKSCNSEVVDAYQDVLVNGTETMRYRIAEAKLRLMREICDSLGVVITDLVK